MRENTMLLQEILVHRGMEEETREAGTIHEYV